MKTTISLLMTGLLFIYSHVNAEANVQVSLFAEKDIFVDGVKQRVAAEDVLPGEEIIYRIQYENIGDLAAEDVNILHDVPEGTHFLPASVWCEDCEVALSQDGGESFFALEAERIKSDKEPLVLRWHIDELDAGASAELGYRVRVE